MRYATEQLRVSSIPALLAISVLIYAFAFAIERFSGVEMMKRVVALSDTSQILLVFSALCMAIALNLVLPSNLTEKGLVEVVKVLLDAFWFTWSALCVGAAYAWIAEGRLEVLTLAIVLPIAAIALVVGGRWIWTDFRRTNPGILVSFILAAMMLVVAAYLLSEVPLQNG
ncbi:hypothetical protein LJR235_002886 [Pararhizobium sp. LjRoot235]|uniref:hypothetical protein n=1 Tax=Pararhizobium sp. LjRoot235 TaxID=3342291 RepID=UPI003ECED0A2